MREYIRANTIIAVIDTLYTIRRLTPFPFFETYEFALHVSFTFCPASLPYQPAPSRLCQ